ncbi:ABC transporter substrate-binding protein [Priestia aryabhattai]|uniref:nucleoside hydrolase n=1 Tax=Bacillaceae TaxID=186817 RepID=UPI000BA132F5|nr:nucleoside hydrolase [Bacillus sp. CBEL-1]OZT11853.1 ABC transporter substrate-binding protein [Priestia aryabhattai]TDB55507.1 ABC transporter substrate-binding protein [Bacillus sp. CBEL-1]USY56073.1 nucleoside hydrolase [Bacillus sp. 1780r2a1]
MKKKVYFNHDAGIDDLVSLFLLLQMDDVELTGVSVIPADGYLEPGISASRKIIDRFSTQQVEVARSTSRGMYPFPKEWRMHTFFVDALPILNESGQMKAPVSDQPAHRHLIEKVRAEQEKTTLLFTGPLTDLARALDEAPDIEKKIEKLVWMGGTFQEVGNVQEPEHDGTAEWNAFWDPEAVDRVWKSGLTIEMVALESTNQVPLTISVRNYWASLRRYTGVDFVGQCYAACPPLEHFETNSTYYLWDVLTTASVGKPDLVKMKTVCSEVETKVPSQGRTYETAEGRPVHVVYDVDSEAFFHYITELSKKQ